MVAAVELTNQNPQTESHDLEQVTQEMLVHLQSTEMSLPHYRSRLVHLTTDCLVCQLSRAGVGEGESEREATRMVATCIQLLSSTVELIEVYKIWISALLSF